MVSPFVHGDMYIDVQGYDEEALRFRGVRYKVDAVDSNEVSVVVAGAKLERRIARNLAVFVGDPPGADFTLKSGSRRQAGGDEG
jgi:hypothetical protein